MFEIIEAPAIRHYILKGEKRYVLQQVAQLEKIGMKTIDRVDEWD